MKNIQDIFDLISKLFTDDNETFIETLSESDVRKQIFALENSNERILFSQVLKELIGYNLIKYEPRYRYSLTENGKQVIRINKTFRLEISNESIDGCADSVQRHRSLEEINQNKDKNIICVSHTVNPNASELLNRIMDIFCLPYFKFDNSPIIPNKDVIGSNIYGQFDGGNIKIAVLATNIEESQWILAAKKFDANVIICIADNEQDVKTVLQQYNLDDYKITMFDDLGVGDVFLNNSELILQNAKELIKKMGSLINCKEFKEFDKK